MLASAYERDYSKAIKEAKRWAEMIPEIRGDYSAESVIALLGGLVVASRQEAPAASAQPMFFASPEQAKALQDRPDDAEGGVYLPLRKTVAGKFTMPLYAAPTAARSPATVAQPVEDLRSAVEFLDQMRVAAEAGEDVTATGVAKDAREWLERAARAVVAQPCPSQGCGGAAVRHALQQIVDADDAQALTQQLIEIGRAALSGLEHVGKESE